MKTKQLLHREDYRQKGFHPGYYVLSQLIYFCAALRHCHYIDPHNLLRKPNPNWGVMFQTTPHWDGNTASYKCKKPMCQTTQAVRVRVDKPVMDNDTKTGKTERIVLEPSGNRNEMRREKAHQLNRKGGDVVFSLLYCCERIHFGLVGARMPGSSSVCKCEL